MADWDWKPGFQSTCLEGPLPHPPPFLKLNSYIGNIFTASSLKDTKAYIVNRPLQNPAPRHVVLPFLKQTWNFTEPFYAYTSINMTILVSPFFTHKTTIFCVLICTLLSASLLSITTILLSAYIHIWWMLITATTM